MIAIKMHDVVKNKITKVVGTVNAKYTKDKSTFIDVATTHQLTGKDQIWYQSPIENWEVLEEYEEGESGPAKPRSMA